MEQSPRVSMPVAGGRVMKKDAGGDIRLDIIADSLDGDGGE